MKLNGERIVFHGVNRHEFSCDHGRAVTEGPCQNFIPGIAGSVPSADGGKSLASILPACVP